jgi:hypothetical protein
MLDRLFPLHGIHVAGLALKKEGEVGATKL